MLSQPAEGRINRVVAETGRFFAMVSKGPLSLGHLLILPKKHYISIATMPEEYFPEFSELRRELGIRLTSAFHFPQTLLFEHGSSNTDLKGGCCISHAHMHIMPVRLPSTRVVRKIREALEGNNSESKAIEMYRELRDLADEETAYAFFEFDGMKHFSRINRHMPSQFIRQAIGKYVGREYTWDWRQNPRIEDIIETVERLKNGD
jgi:diadenosine tetraphosphate (Ap4A) HIT family hydrolase